MRCDFRRCTAEATMQCRFGDGLVRNATSNKPRPGKKPGAAMRQTLAHYCDDHFQVVDRWFHLCDVETAGARRARGSYRRAA